GGGRGEGWVKVWGDVSRRSKSFLTARTRCRARSDARGAVPERDRVAPRRPRLRLDPSHREPRGDLVPVGSPPRGPGGPSVCVPSGDGPRCGPPGAFSGPRRARGGSAPSRGRGDAGSGLRRGPVGCAVGGLLPHANHGP